MKYWLNVWLLYVPMLNGATHTRTTPPDRRTERVAPEVIANSRSKGRRTPSPAWPCNHHGPVGPTTKRRPLSPAFCSFLDTDSRDTPSKSNLQRTARRQASSSRQERPDTKECSQPHHPLCWLRSSSTALQKSKTIRESEQYFCTSTALYEYIVVSPLPFCAIVPLLRDFVVFLRIPSQLQTLDTDILLYTNSWLVYAMFTMSCLCSRG